VEEYINIKGIPVRLMDTAGIRMTEDFVEKIGIEKSREVIEQADLVIFLLDIAAGITDEDLDIFRQIDENKLIILVNKEDLEEKNIGEEEINKTFADVPVIRGSVKKEVGIEQLEQTIQQMLLHGEYAQDGLEIMMNMRQLDALLKSRAYVASALEQIDNTSLDCLGVDLRGALDHLGEITGKSFKEELIDKIFHDFCIGK
jgi:tRNA modification GTPase